ncbi:MAG: DUF4912 domain-containing protein [Endomicrobium sp.]|jgi:hypothetical protein|uniref:DUF4912 domain-containing protein n=1 Tax=Candidatus Endomicrobiellum cubanum TaxID=3242325 RepID=UPI00281B750E|nr:DUF4912 domain-containing protein [Endomicrobium sp.]
MTFTKENLSSKLNKVNKAVSYQNCDLPRTYNDTKIVILPKDPIWIYTYWEISTHTIEEFQSKDGEPFNILSLVLRVYDISYIDFDGFNANKYFDIRIRPDALSWYINLGEYNCSWCVDLGYFLRDGRFITIARSNTLTSPRYGISDITEEQWASLKLEFEKLLKMSNDVNNSLNSYDLVKAMQAHWEEFLKLPSSKVFGGSSSGRPLSY